MLFPDASVAPDRLNAFTIRAHRFAVTLAAVLVISVSTGCGFQLKNNTGALGSLGAVRLVASGEFAAVRGAFRQAFRDQGVPLLDQVESPAPDSASEKQASGNTASGKIIVVGITRESTYRRSVLTSAFIDAAEYELRLEVDIIIRIDGSATATEATLSAARIYAVDAVNLAGSHEEEQWLLDAMREELAHRMLRRVEAAVATYRAGAA